MSKSKSRILEMMRPIAYQRSFVTLTGSINAALLLSQAVYWTPKSQDKDGWFYKSAEEWEEETGLTWEQQSTARKKLKETGLWEERRGDRTVYFRVLVDALEEKLADMLRDFTAANPGNLVTPNQEIPDNQSGKPGSSNKEKPDLQIRENLISITETTTETTAEITTEKNQHLNAAQAPTFAEGKNGKNGKHHKAEGLILEPEQPKPTQEIWQAYSRAYAKRYGTDPVRNAKVNANILQLYKRLGAEAAKIAEFYLSHNAQPYVRSAHSTGPMLMDAEKLRTEWATRRKITTSQATQADRQENSRDQLERLRSQGFFEAKP